MSRTTYAVAATFVIDDQRSNAPTQRLLVGNFHDKERALEHARRCKQALARIPWLRDVDARVETNWHLKSGSSVAQLTEEIFGRWVEGATRA